MCAAGLVYEEGFRGRVRYLEEIKVYKSAKEDREVGEPFSKNPPFTSDVLRRNFTVTGGKTFFEFVWMLTWAPYPSGAKTRPFFELAKAKKKYLDANLRTAAKSAVGW
jgi:hypothetical protein